MLKTLLNFFGGGILTEIGDQLNRAYQAKLDAETDEMVIRANELIEQLHAQQNILLVEQKRWLTAWVRPMLALPVIIVVWKLLVWDTTLGLGSTGDPGQIVFWLITTIVGAYMLTRPFERK